MTAGAAVEGPERLRLGILVAAVVGAYLLFPQTTFLIPDSSGTYAWGRSLLFDQDVDFADELARLGWIDGDRRVRFHAETASGLRGNPFGMGSGLLWAPFLVVAEIGLRAAGAAAEPPGYADLHVLAASAGTALYGLAALLLSYVVAARRAPAGAALLAVLACGFGTPFLAYLVHLPTYSHVNAAFAAALVLGTADRARRSAAWIPWAAAGAAVGLAGLVRAQHLLLLAIPLALWVETARREGPRRTGARVGALIGGAGAVFSLQLLAWARIYGAPLLVPQGEGFLDLRRPHLIGVLFSAWHGLFAWAPVLLVAVAGLPLLFRRDRALAAGIATALAAEVWLVASVPDWWGGYAVGARRLVDLTPLFAVGLAAAFAFLRDRAWRRLPAVLTAAAIAGGLISTAAVRSGVLSPFREIGYAELLTALPRATLSLPAYLWQQVRAPRAALHLVIHRDSPVRPILDIAPGWLLPVVLGACWALGLAIIHLLVRSRWRASPGGPSAAA